MESINKELNGVGCAAAKGILSSFPIAGPVVVELLNHYDAIRIEKRIWSSYRDYIRAGKRYDILRVTCWSQPVVQRALGSLRDLHHHL